MAYDTQDTDGFSDTLSAIMFAASSDGGKTWSKPLTVIDDGDLNAAPSIEVDDSNDVWVSWWDGTSGNIKIAQMPAGGSFSTPVVIAGAAAETSSNSAPNALALDRKSGRLYDAISEDNGGTNPVLMRSTDGGATWSPGATFSSQFASEPDLAVDAKGRLYLTFDFYTATGPGFVTSRVVSYSTDGLSFSAPAALHTTGFYTGLVHESGGLTLSPDGSTFADFTLEICGAVHCVVVPPPFVDQGTFGQTTGFDEQTLELDLGTLFPINGFYHAGELFGLGVGPPPATGGTEQFGLAQITFGGPVLFWPQGITNVQQVFAVGTSRGAVFATRQGFNPGYIVPGYCQ